MPRIFDNIKKPLLPALQETLQVAERADFCVGYFNLRGWQHRAGYVDLWAGGEDQCCRMLVITACPPEVDRTTRETAPSRNRHIISLAAEIIAPYLAAGSPLAALMTENRGRPC